MTDSFLTEGFTYRPRMINCPKHGIHEYFITSTVDGHEGHWCQICWLESLGPSLPLVEEEQADG
jgi:hypothetical protein